MMISARLNGLTMPGRKIPNDAEFRRLWESGRALYLIAAVYGVVNGTVSNASRRYGFAPRYCQKRISRGTGERHTKPQAALAPPPPVMHTAPLDAPGWTRARDALIVESGGRYSALNDLAQRFGVPSARVLGRWQQLRGKH